LEATYHWALEVNLAELSTAVRRSGNTPLLAIGSGGSLSTACLIASLEQQLKGNFASFDTPLLASRNRTFFADARVFIVSARGRNPDVLGFAKLTVAAEPSFVTSLCCM
jgi:fructoselysine-6-P-deglycase FrlB-like protein